MKIMKAIATALCIGMLGCGAVDPRDGDESAMEPVASTAQALSSFTVGLWPGGVVEFAFSGLSGPEQDAITARMTDWETASANAVIFHECVPNSNCPTTFLNVRKDVGTETGGKCSIGRQSGGFCRFDPTDSATILHELGHAIGLKHEHQRGDRDRFLDQGNFMYPSNPDDYDVASASTLPILGNYDYDSAMHYASLTGGNGTSGTLRWKDRLGNQFSRWVSDSVSIHDASRVLQLYARDFEPKWDFFRSLSPLPANADTLPNPYLVPGVEAVGTPAIAYTNSTTHIFVRGSDDNMYWKTGNTSAGTWTSLGCCAGSDPSAVSAGTNQIDLVFIGSSSGKLIRNHYSAGTWGGWFYVQDGMPSGGIRTALVGTGYVGPGIGSRGTNQMDIFVVRAADGLLSSISFDGSSWTGWRTHSGSYYVRARPAVAALSASELAVAFTRSTTVHVASVLYSGATVTSFSVSGSLGNVIANSAPAITKRSSSSSPYRVIAPSASHKWLWHYMANASAGRYIGGIPQLHTGVSAVATGSFSADMVMNGTEQLGCDVNCRPGQPNPGGVIQPGGIWFRRFE